MSLIVEKIANLFPKKANSWEILLWVVVAVILSGQFWITLFCHGYINIKDLQYFYTSIVSGVITILIPLIFWLANGKLPLEALRNRYRGIAPNSKYNIQSEKNLYINYKDDEKEDSDITETALAILKVNAVESSLLASNLFRRSGLYLFIGTFIAVVGVLIFSYQGIYISRESDLTALIISLAPRAGILIFIELIAFFFLKQYKAAMDEHRYFEAVKRERQRAYAITTLLSEDGTKVELLKYVEACGYNREFGKLKQGESTEIIEGKKLQDEELKLIEKVLAAIRKN